MKAWLVYDPDDYADVSGAVVFAETRGKAHALARDTECCECSDWINICVRRMPLMDPFYRPGHFIMEWDNSEDRIALVRECGWHCHPDYLEEDDCPNCPAAKWCEYYHDQLEEKRHETFSQ